MLNKINNYLYIYNLYTHKMFFDPLSIVRVKLLCCLMIFG